MKITIPHLSWDTDLREMRERHSDLAGTKRPVNGGTEYFVSDNLMPQADLAMALSKDVKIDEAIVFVRVASSVLTDPVDPALPDPTYIDGEGVTQPRNYSDYFSGITLNVAGDEALVQVGNRAYGAKNSNTLTTDAEIRAWLVVFGGLLGVQESSSLRTTIEWLPVV